MCESPDDEILKGVEWNDHSGFAGRRSCIEWQAIPVTAYWAESTKLAQISTWAQLTNTGKVLAWPGIEPGTFFCHGRCSNH